MEIKTKSKVVIAKVIFKCITFFGIKKNILVKRNSIKWSLDLSEGIDLSIFLFGSFQGDIIKSIKNFIFNKNKKINYYDIIDVGSNIGDKSLSLSKTLLKKNFNNFKIFSIEATDFAFNKQIKNISLNPVLKKKISIFKYFISSNKFKPKKTYSSWKLKKSKNTHKIHMGALKRINKLTKSITLDEFVKKNRIKNQIILKIDVDGFEMNVLKSCKRLLKNNNPIIFMEYAPYALKEHGSSINEFNKFLKKYNYKKFDLDFIELNYIKIKDGSSKDIILIKDKKI